MSFVAAIDIQEDFDIIYEAMKPEENNGFQRGSWNIDKENKRIHITAKDSVAFRAMLSTITNALILYEKTK